MTFKKAAILLMAPIILFSNCSKKGGTSAPPDTQFRLTVNDNLGNAVSGATVRLYASQSDFTNDLNRVSVKTTDASGIVTFTGLSAIKYYWFAEKGCTNNIFGSVATASPITANNTTTITTVLGSTGALRFVNTSANPYRVYINGTAYAEMNGGTTKIVDYAVTGSYTIRVLQLSGYAVTPTDLTYTGTLTCGATLSTTFP